MLGAEEPPEQGLVAGACVMSVARSCGVEGPSFGFACTHDILMLPVVDLAQRSPQGGGCS